MPGVTLSPHVHGLLHVHPWCCCVVCVLRVWTHVNDADPPLQCHTECFLDLGFSLLKTPQLALEERVIPTRGEYTRGRSAFSVPGTVLSVYRHDTVLTTNLGGRYCIAQFFTQGNWGLVGLMTAQDTRWKHFQNSSRDCLLPWKHLASRADCLSAGFQNCLADHLRKLYSGRRPTPKHALWRCSVVGLLHHVSGLICFFLFLHFLGFCSQRTEPPGYLFCGCRGGFP